MCFMHIRTEQNRTERERDHAKKLIEIRGERKSSTPFHEIPPGYEAHLFCGYHFHLALFYSTLSRSSATEEEY